MHQCSSFKHFDLILFWWKNQCNAFSEALNQITLLSTTLIAKLGQCWRVSLVLMYKELIKVSISLLNMAVSFSTALHTCLGCCRLNSANDFLDIVSCIAAVLLSRTVDTYFLYCLLSISLIVCTLRTAGSSGQLRVSKVINSD